MLMMAVFTLTMVVLSGLVAAFVFQRFAVVRDAARGEVEEELNAKLRDDQSLADRVAVELDSDTPIDRIVASCQRDRATLLPADVPRTQPWNWTVDDLVRWQRSAVASRIRSARRRCFLALAVLGATFVILTITANAVLYDGQYSRTRDGLPTPRPFPAPVAQPTKGATP